MRRLAYLGVLLLLAGLAAGIAVAASISGEVRAVSGEVTARPLGTPQTRPCGAPGDNTVRIRATIVGTVTSSDASLAGDARARVTVVLDNDTGDGTVRGWLRIRDSQSGRLKVFGRVVGATTGLTDPRTQGLIDARVFPGGGELVANFTLSQNADGSLTGEFGKDTPVAPSNKAVISTAC
jgi:hypothetical protein